jgi:hypothetical protein
MTPTGNVVGLMTCKNRTRTKMYSTGRSCKYNKPNHIRTNIIDVQFAKVAIRLKLTVHI